MKSENLIIILITIYDFVKDFLKSIVKELIFCIERPNNKRPPSKKFKLELAEILTLWIFKFFCWFKEWKKYYNFIKTYHLQDFPNLPNYQNFVSNMNKISFLSLIMLEYFMNIFKENTLVTDLKFVDSTKLEVCKIKREFSHKVCKRIANKSKSSMWWFYWFKLHIICNEYMQILNFRLTSWNVDDRVWLEMMWNDIFGMIIADAWYIWKEWQKKAQDNWKYLFTAVKANMKKLMTNFQHNLLKMRQRVEMVFSVLKTRMNLETSLPRSEVWHFTHYILCLTAYQLKKFFDFTLNKKFLA